jgi:prepilin-type N-terminal cleavage/methylation domain-containing protein
MIFRKTKLCYKNEAGFTLIEILVSLAITALIGLGATMSIAQMLNQTARNNDFTTASRNAMNAVYWISRDAQMAQTISGVAGFPGTSDLSLAWVDWNNSSHNATYSMANDRLLRTYRTYNVDGQITETTETLIAEYINPSANMTSCVSVNGTLTLTITSSVGEGSRVVDVTRIRDMTSRPKL